MTPTNYEVIEHDHDDIEHVVLETSPVRLAVDNTRDLGWLAAETMSTPFATITRD